MNGRGAIILWQCNVTIGSSFDKEAAYAAFGLYLKASGEFPDKIRNLIMTHMAFFLTEYSAF
jgi:hypothetical protein